MKSDSTCAREEHKGDTSVVAEPLGTPPEPLPGLVPCPALPSPPGHVSGQLSHHPVPIPDSFLSLFPPTPTLMMLQNLPFTLIADVAKFSPSWAP